MRKGLVLSLLVAAVLTPLLALAVALSTELPRRDLVLVALIFFIYAFINGLLLDGFQTALAPEQREPNDGLKASIWNAIRVGVVSFFAFGPIILGCLVALSSRDGIVESVRAVGPAAALLSLVLALLMSLWKGLLAVIQHVILRILLWRSGCAPLHYTAWLEQMTKRRLLYRVGGGYVFMHAMLQAHLAGGAGGQDRVGR
jgi:hypothetical protein